jgi:molybdenum cofactor cytidylyltransferase
MAAQTDIILLAAGKSERMGLSNKLLLTLAGEPLLALVLEELRQTHAHQRIVVTGHEAEKIATLIPTESFLTVHNPGFEEGMTSSIQCGVKSLAASSTGVMIVPGDLPNLRAASLNRLMDTFQRMLTQNDKLIVAASDQGVQKNPVIFSSYYYAEILNHSTPNGCKKIIENHTENLVLVEIQDKQFFSDIDTPQDYAMIQS